MMSQDSSNTGFRTSLCGYNKEDVNKYILSENENFRQREADYIRRIEELENKVSDVSPGMLKDSGRTAILESENASLKDEIGSLNEEIAALREEIESLRSADTAPAPDGSIGVKVDEILDYAVKEAERILEEAKAAGLRSRDEIERNTEMMKTEIQNRSESIIEDLRQKIAASESVQTKRRPGRPPKNKPNAE